MKKAGLLVGVLFALAFPTSALANVSEGASGEHVKAIQAALGITPTGYFGPVTDRAVVAYQERNGLLVDGIVGPQTDGSLFGTHRSSGVSVQKPAARPARSSTSSGSGGSSVPSSIVACESRGNYSAVNPSSGAGGRYQIMPSTWRAYGGSGSPQNAPPSEQDAIASKIWQSQGAKAWSCKG